MLDCRKWTGSQEIKNKMVNLRWTASFQHPNFLSLFLNFSFQFWCHFQHKHMKFEQILDF